MAVADRLQQFLSFADTLAEFEEFGEAIPLTGISPSAEKALGLGELFSSIEAKLAVEIASFPELDRTCTRA